MVGRITKTELQAYLAGQMSPADADVLKQKLIDKLFAKAIWTLDEAGVEDAEHISFAIEVAMSPVEAASKSAESLIDPINPIEVTLRCCTGGGCGDCGPINVGP